MAILDIEFEWTVAVAGYQVVDYGPRPAPLPIEQTEIGRAIAVAAGFVVKPAPEPPSDKGPPWGMQIVPRGIEMRRATPLALNRELYLRFAELEDKPAAFAEFATRWGLLTTLGRDAKAETPDVWSYHLNLMKHALAVAQDDPRNLAFFDPAGDERRVAPSLTARLVWVDGRISLRITPLSLLHGLWLQLFQSVSRGTDLKSCDRCGRLFERGPGTERGRKARFCSDTCRFGFHNERRGKGGSQ